ncbi:hypothetical protein V5E97_20860 [Singulisphaera sp. Ch08]|uniref:Alpha/beta hydrolase n=1 Tax=Singulisphaera sp. Ch08 TaxID=3120278 RepID=A0AAU7C6Q3_9BACT
MPKMLILRGNSGPNYPDESGKPHNYDKGALHEQAAVEYARRKGYQGLVLDISGDPDRRPGKTRATSPQTLLALTTLETDDSITGLYGFSGGGYNVWWILRTLGPKVLSRLKLVVVLGAPDRPASEYEARNFGAGWELVYKKDPPKGHMFGPEQLLQETPDLDSGPPRKHHETERRDW